MYSKLEKALAGKPDNHILPFLWMKGEEISKTLRQLYRAHEAGIGAVCLESRTFEDFAGETWWSTVETILKEARKLNMKVWILDDKHFPTGYANGLIETKYPQKRPLMLCEKHIDVIGPGQTEWLLKPFGKEDTLVGLCAYKRVERSNALLTGSVLTLPLPQEEGIVTFDLPGGCWRVFALWATRSAGSFMPNYIDMMDAESVKVQLEAVYEPHYAHFSAYFGNTLAGFFSDEPCLGNGFFVSEIANKGFYARRPGQIGLGMSWHPEMLKTLSKKLGRDAMPLLPQLWFDGPERAEVRAQYMDTVADRYSECFNRSLGDWCREHGCEYIGHVIEDNDCHTSLGRSCAHYFRGLKWQDMSGIDIVLHQVMPGLAEYDNATICATGAVSSSFFHYMLGKLASSLANITPRMKGRAMCEVFGAYGWAEGVSFMKWLIDFLLVRGINMFVPHAFSPIHPNPDCPPHFDADGTNPQFEDFSHLMRYTNAAADLLSGKRVNRLAVLYHAEAEWSSMPFTRDNEVAVELTDNHIDFDILPSEALSPAEADSRIHAGEAAYDALIVPYAEYLPEKVIDTINSLGVPVFETDALTEGLDAEVIPLGSLASELGKRGYRDIGVDGDNRLLRISHTCNDEADVFMLFNEYTDRPVSTCIQLPVHGSYIFADLLGNRIERRAAEDGSVDICLEPYESCFLIFDGANEALTEPEKELRECRLDPLYNIDLADAESLDEYEPFASGVTAEKMPKLDPYFGGHIRYTASINLSDGAAYLLLKDVGDTACIRLNGSKPLRRICGPFLYDISSLAKEGENYLEITVSTTLARRVRDDFSSYMPIKKFGFGSLSVLYHV